VIEALHKSQHTESQVGKSSAERRKSVNDAFELVPQFHDHLQNKNVLLIDDVCTTGSTLQACTVVLRDAGVKTVYVATVSRAKGIGFDS
jgi:predicted amidophosphoribosyltransferase